MPTKTFSCVYQAQQTLLGKSAWFSVRNYGHLNNRISIWQHISIICLKRLLAKETGTLLTNSFLERNLTAIVFSVRVLTHSVSSSYYSYEYFCLTGF